MDGGSRQPEPAPFYTRLARGSVEGQAHWIRTRDDRRLRVGEWRPSGTARGTVFLFPGRTEYIEKYADAAGVFAAHGLASLAMDWRGQGLADRLLDEPLLGHVERFSDYQLDVQALTEFATVMELPKPWFLLGHSMGGAIGLRALYEGLPVQAAAFSAPMWGINVPTLLRPFAMLIGATMVPLGLGDHLAPGTSLVPYVLTQPLEGNLLTRDRVMYDMLRDQISQVPALAIAGPTTNWVFEGMRECKSLHARPSPELPCLTFLGGDEQIVSTAAIHERMERWPNGSLRIVDNVRHEVLMEDQITRHRVLGELIAFFLRSG